MMKQKTARMIAAIATVTMITGAAIADEHGKMMDKDKDMSGKMEMKKDMPMMQDGMMGGMMKRQVVATSDGGVIIVVGNLLLKYDKDLNLVKKTTIEISDEDMQQMMKKMKEQCGMRRKMMKEMKTEENE